MYYAKIEPGYIFKFPLPVPGCGCTKEEYEAQRFGWIHAFIYATGCPDEIAAKEFEAFYGEVKGVVA